MPEPLFGPAFCSTRTSSGVTSRSGSSIARREILEALEHHRAALVLEQPGIRRRALEDRAARRERAEQRDQAADLRYRLGERPDHAAIDLVRLALEARPQASRP